MNLSILIFDLIFIINNVLAQNNTFKNNYNLKEKRDSASGECQYINGLLNQSELYDCCNHEGIICLNNHITTMYIFFLFFIFIFFFLIFFFK